jgi:phosphohistidine phosphatase
MRNAQATARWFVDEGPDPDLALCSDAVRARQTWQVISAGLPHPVPCHEERRLYGTSATDIIAVVRGVNDDVGTVVVVGHEPGMSDTVLLLAGAGSDPSALSQLSTKFPTNGVAVLRLTTTWSTLGPRTAVLERFEVPRS